MTEEHRQIAKRRADLFLENYGKKKALKKIEAITKYETCRDTLRFWEKVQEFINEGNP